VVMILLSDVLTSGLASSAAELCPNYEKGTP
jgi:hypothetical protein